MKRICIIAIAILSSIPALSQVQRKGQQSQADKLNEHYCTGPFKTTDGTILDVASEASTSGYSNIFRWMQGRVAGFQVYTTRSGVTVPLIRGNVPAIYIDEMPSTAAAVNLLPVTEIAMVKVIKTPFYAGLNSAHGAIAVYTLDSEEDQ